MYKQVAAFGGDWNELMFQQGARSEHLLLLAVAYGSTKKARTT